MLMSYDILGKYPEINLQIHRISDIIDSFMAAQKGAHADLVD